MKKIIIFTILFSNVFYLHAQINTCDSVSYTTAPGQVLTVNLNITSGLASLVDSMDIYWQACNATTCYLGFDTMAIFQDVLPTDTIKVCYDAYIYIDTNEYFCYQCDSLIYDGNSWVLLNVINPNEIVNFTSFSISDFFPNPAKEIVYFDYNLNQSAELFFTNELGQKLMSIMLEAKGKQKVNLSALSKGIYFGNILVNNEIITVKKLIVR